MHGEWQVVVKVGTGVLTDDKGCIKSNALANLVDGLADLFKAGFKCLLVSSGAVGAGVGVLGRKSYPREVAARQACAAVGQAELMRVYSELCKAHGIRVAQILLTASDLDDKRRKQNAARALAELAGEEGVLPIINENDCVAVEELTFGDNDMLSVKVSELSGAKTLILLTSVDGLMIGGPDGELIEQVTDLEEAKLEVRGESGKFSIGGMANKLKAIEAALEVGIQPIIANGNRPRHLLELVQGGGTCTRF